MPEFFSAFGKKQKKTALTCKKLSVASFCASETAERMPLGAAEGFNWIVRSRHCGELNRGLQNLGASYEGVRVVTFCIVQKVTKKHAGLRPATSIQIAGRYVFEAKVTGFHKVTGFAKSCNFTGYRRQ